MKVWNTTLPLLVALAALGGCNPPAGNSASSEPGNPATDSPFKVANSIQDIMRHQIDSAADGLWESVSTTMTEAGVEEKRPQTDEEWFELRSHAITLMETANLLNMAGRKVLLPGQTLEDEGIEGVLSAAEIQARIDADRAQFVQFTHLLHDVSAQMLKAVDARDVQGVFDAGAALYTACESCHMTFWYPNQKIPTPPE
jgi:hypothetical protein